MYNLPRHLEKNEELVLAFIARHPFAVITGSNAAGQPVATQLPMFIEEKNGRKYVRGHMMKNLDHHRAFMENENVLVLFTGPQIYVSATWYHNPHQASTWNYMTVHARGKIKFLDEQALIDVLRMTTLHFENGNRDSTTIYDNLSPEYKQRLLPMIVAFEIELSSLDAVFKLSQDRDPVSFKSIIEKLSGRGEDGKEIAEEMAKRFDEVFAEREKG
jgi:transcriptional regulator